MDEQEDENDDDGSILHEVQALTEELMWLSGRTRPDISYAVCFIGGKAMFVASCSIGRNVSKYLNATKSFGLEYLPFEKAKRRNSSTMGTSHCFC